MKYLMLAIAIYFFLYVAYIFIGSAYKKNGVDAATSKLESFFKLYRYVLATSCMTAVFLWKGAEPPVLDMSKLQVSEGVVNCKNSSGRRVTGSYKMDGIDYKRTFGYVFGIGSAVSCSKELNERRVRIYWLPIYNEKERLLMEILDVESGHIYGLTKEKNYILYKQEIENKTMLYLAKLGLILFSIYLIFWSQMQNIYLRLRRKSNG